MKQTYDVEILGQKFKIKSDESSSHVDRVVEYINEKIRRIAKAQKTKSTHDTAILALLNVADELFRSKTEIGDLKERIVQKTKKIVRFIDAP
jgi:cell division protein ZapA